MGGIPSRGGPPDMISSQSTECLVKSVAYPLVKREGAFPVSGSVGVGVDVRANGAGVAVPSTAGAEAASMVGSGLGVGGGGTCVGNGVGAVAAIAAAGAPGADPSPASVVWPLVQATATKAMPVMTASAGFLIIFIHILTVCSRNAMVLFRIVSNV